MSPDCIPGKVVEEMQIGTADCTAGHFDDGVALMLDARISNSFAADVRRAVPDECLHFQISAALLTAGRTLIGSDRSKLLGIDRRTAKYMYGDGRSPCRRS